MPKFYIRDVNNRYIIDDVNPLRACANAIMKYSATLLVNGHYWVSEKGFDLIHEEDIKVSSDEVNMMIYAILQKRLEEDT